MLFSCATSTAYEIALGDLVSVPREHNSAAQRDQLFPSINKAHAGALCIVMLLKYVNYGYGEVPNKNYKTGVLS